MPRIQSGPATSLADQTHAQVVDRILRELLGEGTFGGPVIFEMPMDSSPYTRVLVVWEAWRGIEPRERSEMISEAYREFEKTLKNSIHHIDPTRDQSIKLPQVSSATAIGATYAEAVEQGLLPYRIVPPTVHGLENLTRMRHAMKSFGLLPESPELLLPTREMQERVYEDLTRQFPDVTFWKSTLPEQD